MRKESNEWKSAIGVQMQPFQKERGESLVTMRCVLIQRQMNKHGGQRHPKEVQRLQVRHLNVEVLHDFETPTLLK